MVISDLSCLKTMIISVMIKVMMISNRIIRMIIVAVVVLNDWQYNDPNDKWGDHKIIRPDSKRAEIF